MSRMLSMGMTIGGMTGAERRGRAETVAWGQGGVVSRRQR